MERRGLLLIAHTYYVQVHSMLLRLLSAAFRQSVHSFACFFRSVGWDVGSHQQGRVETKGRTGKGKEPKGEPRGRVESKVVSLGIRY